MKTQVLSYCSTTEVGSIANNALKELGKKNWNEDTYLTGIIDKLTPEADLLQLSLGLVRKGPYTKELAEVDERFDKSYLATKQFVWANTFSADPQQSENARKVWEVFEAHELDMYRLGYEKQIFRTYSLIERLEKEDMKERVDTLMGVPETLTVMKAENANLDQLFAENAGILARKEELVPPSVQKEAVRDILNNELLPYLDVMSQVKPEVYSETARVVSQYIEDVNTKARSRRSRNNGADHSVEEENI